MSGSPQVSNVASMSISVPASRGRGPAVNVISPVWRWLAAQTQDLLRRGDFRVQVIGVTPARVLCTAGGVPHCSRLRKGGTASRGQRGLLTRNLIGQHEALAYQRDGHRVGVDALARDPAGGVAGAEEG
jgi:hypothetical protein